MSYKSLNHGDVFVLDDGKVIYSWNGKESSKKERIKVKDLSFFATRYLRIISFNMINYWSKASIHRFKVDKYLRHEWLLDQRKPLIFFPLFGVDHGRLMISIV